MKKMISLLLFLLSMGSAGAQQYEIPAGLSSKTTQKVVHTGYTSLFSQTTGQPVWVAWDLTPEEISGKYSRTDEFTTDPALRGKNIPDTRDYSRSGYDRGHMAPAADFKWSLQAMEESFYIGSNICPQNHTLNEKTWCDLEIACRYWARKGTLYIACGPYFTSRNPKTIGAHKVAVPDGFWKVILTKRNGRWQAIGFSFPNAPIEDDFHNYARSVDEIEELTGLDFFPLLDDRTEKTIERTCDISQWQYSARRRN